MKSVRAASLTLLMALVLSGCTKMKEKTLERGIDLFLDNRLELALPVLQASARMWGDNPEAHAWLAECLRRLQRFDQAADEAYAALRIDGHHAFAHTVLGDLYNPHYSAWVRTDLDSTWFHLREAVKHDPSDGNAWSALWIQAMRRGDGDIEKKAAARMIDSGFLSKALLAYNRWQLCYLPPDAILLTNGDMDTYPAVALQERDAVRQDVAVVNLSLLNLPWYQRLVAERHGLPLPFEPDEAETLKAIREQDGDIITPSQQVVRSWLAMQSQGGLCRPLCAAITVCGLDSNPQIRDRMVLCGAYYEIMPSAVQEKVDLSRLGNSLEGVDPADFEGSFTTPIDRSPIRRSATDRIATNITGAMLKYADILAESERWDEASNMLARAEQYDSRILARGQYDDQMDALRQRIQVH